MVLTWWDCLFWWEGQVAEYISQVRRSQGIKSYRRPFVKVWEMAFKKPALKSIIRHKGSTINNLGGARRKNGKWIYFFRGNAFWELFFPGEGLLRFIFSLRKTFWDLFFPGEGPPKFFFLDFLRALPQIINGRPLIFHREVPLTMKLSKKQSPEIGLCTFMAFAIHHCIQVNLVYILNNRGEGITYEKPAPPGPAASNAPSVSYAQS